MNERIRKLELEAIAYADSKVPAHDRYNDIYYSIVRGKFAELIIKECMGLVDGYTYPVQTQSRTIFHIASETIKEHFGVEE